MAFMKHNMLTTTRLLALGFSALAVDQAFAADDEIQNLTLGLNELALGSPPAAEVDETFGDVISSSPAVESDTTTNISESAPEIDPDYMPINPDQFTEYEQVFNSGDSNTIAALAEQYQTGAKGTKNLSVAVQLANQLLKLSAEEMITYIDAHMETIKDDATKAAQYERLVKLRVGFVTYTQSNYGDRVPQYNLGRHIIETTQAASWQEHGYRLIAQAADQEYAPALNDLGCAYLDGIPGTELQQDEALAVSYFERGVFQNYAPSQYNLALCYAIGCGVTQNIQEAKELCIWPASNGHVLAIELLTVIESNTR
jgi:hypothetical protein